MVEERPTTLDELAARGRRGRKACGDASGQQEQYRKDALKSFQKWYASWNGLVPELDKFE